MRPSISGFKMTLSHGGQFKIIHLTSLKCLNTTAVVVVAIMASTIGALKSASLMALTDRAKQNVVIVSMVKHRKPRKRLEDAPASNWALRTLQNALICQGISMKDFKPD